MTQRSLDRLLRLWQERLRLSDWRVTVESKPLADCQGWVQSDPLECTAKILVTPGDRSAMESTLVHELLHLRLLPLWDGDCSLPKDKLHPRETAINLLAATLLDAWKSKL